MAPQTPKYTITEIKELLRNGNDGKVISFLESRIMKLLKDENATYTAKQDEEYGASYKLSYKPIIKHFKYLKKQDPCNEKWLIHGASLVYSWMPTILNLRAEHTNEAICSMKNIKKRSKELEQKLLGEHCSQIVSEIAPVCEIALLRNCINNSIRGASKFLHFSYPKTFPILDSRVAKAVHEDECREAIETIFTPNKEDTDIKYYVAYTEAVHKIRKKKKMCIRAIEKTLFIIGRKYMKQEKERKKMEKEAKNK